MRKTVFAAAIAAVLTLGVANASAPTAGTATKADVQAIQAQMQALVERLDKLEANNVALQSSNAELKALADRREAELESLKTQTRDLREAGAVASTEIEKVEGTDWASKIKLHGDFRYRHEALNVERVADNDVEDGADRHRQRIRARLGLDFKVTDHLTGTFLVATGGDDPRGTNQTLGDASSRKPIGLDQAYADWQFMQGGNLILGKQPNPIFRPGQTLFYDTDFNPEGGAVKFQHGSFFGTAYGWWITEQYNSDPDGENSDATLFGLQAGLKFPLLGGETIVAAHYSGCGACQDNSPLYNNNANGNTTYTIGTSPTNLLAYDYDVVEVAGQMGTSVGDLPLTIWANYAQNTADDVEFDIAYAAGVMLGRATDPRTWEVGLSFQSVDKDALFGAWTDSDLGNGNTDSDGWLLKAGYAPVKNFNMQATYLLNALNKNVGDELDHKRLQLDLNYKF